VRMYLETSSIDAMSEHLLLIHNKALIYLHCIILCHI
jgi:hypothetical protein